MERSLASLPYLQQGPACQPHRCCREQATRSCTGDDQGAARREVPTARKDQQREGRLSKARAQGLRSTGGNDELAGAGSGGNAGLMESVEDRTIRLSGLPRFPQPLEITKCGDFTHSHRTTATRGYDDVLALQPTRHFSFAATGFV